ncbi:enoyl-CoA hydratase [Sneathiella litorea]|uniref:Enoyl-CoA hydratase n=1 Tax=Sneathiella litorea TaxID=2606216 RepID=A0A6L8W676_9PROT|nr:enoyl-CoA hydratase [Sneathiella litorea]MZR30646.1 enoyl-CoA hydratase [Sneathiella litorea]
MTYKTIRYETPSEHVARITLDRPEKRNAQSIELLYELNDAFDTAAHDNSIKVIVLAANGPHFSSGHDLSGDRDMSVYKTVTQWGGFDLPGAEGRHAREEEIYLGFCQRWRDIPKPTIAQVQGKVIAGGLMLVSICDLIVASDDATFSDPTVAFGVNGVEWFSHPWDFGLRKAKELLFTGGMMGAAEARSVGFVNHVVSLDDLEEFTSSLANRIASRPSMGLRLAKMAVNQAQDAQGFRNVMNSAMALHHVGHSHNQEKFGMAVDPSGADVIKREAKKG